MNQFKKILGVAFLGLASMQVFAGPLQQSAKKEKIKQHCKQIIAMVQGPVEVANKVRSASRLVGLANKMYTGTSFDPYDSTSYLYNSTYGYDPTPELFDYLGINSFLYGNGVNNFDKNFTWDMSSAQTLTDSTVNTFTTGHKLQHSFTRSITSGDYNATANSYNTAGQKIQTIDSSNSGTLHTYRTDFVLNAQNKVVEMKNWEDGIFITTDSLFYDVEGKLILVKEFDDANLAVFKLEIGYNAQNLMSLFTYSDWNGSGWTPTETNTYQYNAGNHIISIYYADFDGTNWTNTYKDSMTYTGSNMYPTTYEGFSWDDIAMAWEPSTKNDYTYNSDNQILTSTNLYWDGTAYQQSFKSLYYYQAYTPTAVSSVTNTISGSIYPNPAHDELHISLDKASDQFTVSILNMKGQVVMKEQHQQGSTLTINTKSLTEGNYFVQIATSTGTVIKSFTKLN